MDAFSGCKLKSINIPISLNSVGYKAFGISTLETVYVGNCSGAFTGNGFMQATSLIEFVVPDTNTAYSDINGVLYSKDGKTLKQYPTGLKTWNFANGIEVFESGSMSGNHVDLVDVFTVPNTVTNFNTLVDIRAKKIVIPENVKSIYCQYGGNYDTHEIIDITPNNNISMTGYGMIGKNVKAFILRKPVIFNFHTGLFAYFTGFIYVPDESVNNFKEATNWIQFADRIKPLSEYVES